MDKTDEEMAELVDTLDLPIEATSTYEKWQKALEEELGYRYSPTVAERTWRGVEVLYESLPEVGVKYTRYEQWWGYQGVYTSVNPAITGVPAGRFMPAAKVHELIRGLR